MEAQLACASGPVPPPNPTAADRAVDASAAAASADSAALEDGPPEDDVPAARAPAAVAAAPAVELAPATLETQPSAVVERQPSVVVVGERSGSMAFTTSVGDGIDQEVMRSARSSHTLQSAGVCVRACVRSCV